MSGGRRHPASSGRHTATSATPATVLPSGHRPSHTEVQLSPGRRLWPEDGDGLGLGPTRPPAVSLRAGLQGDGRAAWPVPALFQVQQSLKPVRCQRMTVSGWTMETASAQPLHRRDSRTQNSRSERRRRGRGAARWRTASWCRNARFSSTRARRVLTPRRRPVRMRVIMPAIIDQAGRQFNADEVDGVNRRHRRLGRPIGTHPEPGRPSHEDLPGRRLP
jgi:hypothetical protein